MISPVKLTSPKTCWWRSPQLETVIEPTLRRERQSLEVKEKPPKLKMMRLFGILMVLKKPLLKKRIDNAWPSYIYLFYTFSLMMPLVGKKGNLHPINNKQI